MLYPINDSYSPSGQHNPMHAFLVVYFIIHRAHCTTASTLPCFSFLARCASVADLQSKGLLEHVELNCHGSMAWNGSSGTLRKKSESGIFGTHLQKMQNSQIPLPHRQNRDR